MYGDTSGAADLFDAGAQPRCPSCNVMMRPTERGDECPECGQFEPYDEVQPPAADGPAIAGF